MFKQPPLHSRKAESAIPRAGKTGSEDDMELGAPLIGMAMMKILFSMTTIIEERIRSGCEPTMIHNCK